MTKSRFAVRTAAVVALGAAGSLAAPGLASASPIDVPPTPLLCSYVAPIHSVTETDSDALEEGQLFFAVGEQKAQNGQVNWINTATWQSGGASLTATPQSGDVPIALLNTGPGTVVSAVWGPHQNAKGENCFLLPGIDLSQVPGDDDPGDEPGETAQ
ncbi:hypothetical protein G6038_14530 [Rhodococcus sp. 14C212]|uniref:hypothetical protein n=1 Tax=Rhodococcus sp. 14C212 TaxID=2711209 RepID=UPI0013EB4010|nr:hypothetical protein [Rhodococcus sp. 14C212]NGP06674.1 hypothetical protein [Rhodococcus sp. 14C212]